VGVMILVPVGRHFLTATDHIVPHIHVFAVLVVCRVLVMFHVFHK
jgi:hypothetical protein